MKFATVFSLLSLASAQEFIQFSNRGEQNGRELTHCNPIQGTETFSNLCRTVGSTSGTVGTITVVSGYPDIIYRIGGPGLGGQTYNFETCDEANFDTGLSVWDGNHPSASILDCNDDYCGLQSSLTFTLPDDNYYWLRVGGFLSSSGSTTISWTGPPCPTGTGMGDPHFKTWSGEWYDFHGECDLVFASNPEFDNGKGLDIHVRTKARYEYSYIESAAVRIGDEILEVSSFGQHVLNGVGGVPLPAQIDKYDITVEHDGGNKHTFTIDLGEGEKIILQTFKDLVSVKTVGASEESYLNSHGMLGDFRTGAKLGRDGTSVFQDDVAFGKEWQVRDTEPKLFQTDRFPQFPAECTMPSASKAQGRRRLGENAALKSAAEAACAHWGEQKDLCVYDVMISGDMELADAGAF